jgi:hypothetical protein
MADQIRATPRNSLAALLSDAINSGVGYMKDPRRTQQLQGLGRLIESTGIPYTVESLSYDPSGRGLFTGAGGLGGTTRMRPEALEAAMTVAPMVGPTAKLASRGVMATKGLPVGMSTEAVGGMGFLRPTVAPQDKALRLAQERAALPIEQGGLGLPLNNTPEMRAQAMGAIDAVHFSRKGGDYTELDSGKFAIAPFDAVGTHVGSPQAAMERFQNTVGYKVNNPNYALDELTGSSYPVKVLGDKPLLNQNGMPWGEDDLNIFLRQSGGYNWSDVNGGKLTYQDLNADLRKKLFEQQGYTSIPYFNEVEGKGSISYIVPPENIRSRFAAFDPMRRSAAIAAAMGLAAPDLLANQAPVNPIYQDPFPDTTR